MKNEIFSKSSIQIIMGIACSVCSCLENGNIFVCASCANINTEFLKEGTCSVCKQKNKGIILCTVCAKNVKITNITLNIQPCSCGLHIWASCNNEACKKLHFRELAYLMKKFNEYCKDDHWLSFAGSPNLTESKNMGIYHMRNNKCKKQILRFTKENNLKCIVYEEFEFI